MPAAQVHKRGGDAVRRGAGRAGRPVAPRRRLLPHADAEIPRQGRASGPGKRGDHSESESDPLVIGLNYVN